MHHARALTVAAPDDSLLHFVFQAHGRTAGWRVHPSPFCLLQKDLSESSSVLDYKGAQGELHLASWPQPTSHPACPAFASTCRRALNIGSGVSKRTHTTQLVRVDGWRRLLGGTTPARLFDPFHAHLSLARPLQGQADRRRKHLTAVPAWFGTRSTGLLLVQPCCLPCPWQLKAF